MSTTHPYGDLLAFTLTSPEAIPPSLTLEAGIEATGVAPGVAILRPTRPHQEAFILLSAGIHGNETAPVEVLNRIVADLCDGRLPLDVTVMVMFGNPAALVAGRRYLDYDMNRLFMGRHAGQLQAVEARRAAQLEEMARAFFTQADAGARRWHYDLHTAIRGSVFEQFGIYPFPDGRPHDRSELAWLAEAGIGTVLLHSQPSATFSYFTSHHFGAHAFTLELGKARPFGQNDLPRFAGIDRALRRRLAGLGSTAGIQPQLYRAKYDLIKETEAFTLYLADDVENFTALPDGYLIAEDVGMRYVAHGGQERILFPNPKVACGLRAGIVVEPATL